MTVHVKRYEWDWPGAPVLGGNSTGALIAVLDSVLVNGWGQKNVGGISRVGDTATVFVSTGHEKVVGQCVLHAGWDQTEYNGEFEVTEVVDANNYRIKVLGTPTTPGTAGAVPTTKVAPLGWEKTFSATNKGAYRSSVLVGCTRHYLYVDDSYDAYQAAVMGYETMSAIGVGSGAFPLKNGETDSAWTPLHRWVKHNLPTAVSTRPKNAWTLIGDEKRFYLLVDWSSTYTAGGFRHVLYGFGDFTSLVGDQDQYRSFIMSCSSNNTAMGSDVGAMGQRNGTSSYMESSRATLGRSVCRGWDKQPNGTAFGFLTMGSLAGAAAFVSGNDGSGNGVGMSWPSPFRQKTVVAPTYIVDSPKNSFSVGPRALRGTLPGIYAFMHGSILSDGYTFIGAPGMGSKKFLTKVASSSGGGQSGGWAFDLTGPWE